MRTISLPGITPPKVKPAELSLNTLLYITEVQATEIALLQTTVKTLQKKVECLETNKK